MLTANKRTLTRYKVYGPSIKDVRSQGWTGCPVRTFFGKGEGGSSDVDVRTFCCKNHRVFRNLWCVRTDSGNWASADKGRGQFFAISCGRLLWTAPIRKSLKSHFSYVHSAESSFFGLLIILVIVLKRFSAIKWDFDNFLSNLSSNTN